MKDNKEFVVREQAIDNGNVNKKEETYENIKINESNIKQYEKILKICQNKNIYILSIILTFLWYTVFVVMCPYFLVSTFGYYNPLMVFIPGIIGFSSLSFLPLSFVGNRKYIANKLKKIQEENTEIYISSDISMGNTLKLEKEISKYYEKTNEIIDNSFIETKNEDIKEISNSDKKVIGNDGIKTFEKMNLKERKSCLETEKEFLLNFNENSNKNEPISKTKKYS